MESLFCQFHTLRSSLTHTVGTGSESPRRKYNIQGAQNELRTDIIYPRRSSLLNFKAIVAMGKNAVPYIIEKIKIFPSDLVKALNLIYNRRISPDKKVTIKEACRLWIEKLGY